MGRFEEVDIFVQRQRANPADLIEFDRGFYSHWAIYEGDGYVIHVPAEGKNDTRATIRREKLVDVARKVPGKTKVISAILPFLSNP